jgi:NADH:ubiquinone oxidoreductase subunit K
MMMLVSGIVGGMGLICMVTRRTLLGMLVGMQLLVLGSTMTFVLAGVSSGVRIEGHLAGLLITLGGLAQLAGGCALSVRMFLLKNKVDMDELRSLKR